MTQVLTDFIRALRATNVRISTSESLDAAAAIDAVGFDDRALLKESLSQVLAKTPEEKDSFADCFERFFFAEDMGGVDALEAPESATDPRPDAEPAAPGGGWRASPFACPRARQRCAAKWCSRRSRPGPRRVCRRSGRGR